MSYDSWLRVEDRGSRVNRLRLMVRGLGLRVDGLWCRV
jgi:hypothetical protein